MKKNFSFKNLLSKKILLILLLLFTFFSFSNRYPHLELFAQALHKIKTQHVNPHADEKLIFSAIKGILLDLDPYSQILNPKDLDELERESTGRRRGIGIEVERSDSSLLILSVVENSPADKAGLLPGDQLLKLNEKSTKKMTTLDFKKFLKKHKSFKLFARRGDKFFIKKIKQQMIRVESTVLEEMEKGLFYLKIHNFTNKTALDVTQALEKKEIQALLIDIRYNRGGVLEESYKIADLFLQEGVITRYKIRSEKQEKTFKAHHAPYLGDFPIVVLINEYSASASELLAAALQDHKRAHLIGRRSFGKGLIQDFFPLKRDYVLFLSVGEYKTPLGRAINKKGIEPDVVLPFKKEAFKIYRNYKKDPEVSQALKLAKTLLKTK